MHPKMINLVLAIVLCAQASGALADEAPSAGDVAAAVGKSLALVQKSLAEYPKHNNCFSCHHQGIPSLALSLAKAHGYAVDPISLETIGTQTAKDLRGDLENYRRGQGQPGGVTRAGYALFALQSVRAPQDDVTHAVAVFLTERDKDRGYWTAGSNRPPSEASAFTNTFLAVRALRKYGAAADEAATASRIGRARDWLEKTSPKDTEDRVFQLWGLAEAGAESASVHRAAQALLALQQPDGGWSQLPGGASDAYATGSALTALSMSGQLTGADPAYRQGVKYLLHSQEADGSWHVATRSKPVQPYFETGFPHGKDQFISMAATGWATAALILGKPNIGGN